MREVRALMTRPVDFSIATSQVLGYAGTLLMMARTPSLGAAMTWAESLRGSSSTITSVPSLSWLKNMDRLRRSVCTKAPTPFSLMRKLDERT